MNRILTLFVLVLLLSLTTISQAAVINVAGTGSSNAATDNNTYVFAAGEYLYTIAGFNVGDVLAFPAGAVVPSPENVSGSDGIIIVYAQVNGKAITVNLTGIPTGVPENQYPDGQVYGLISFKTVFGAGSIIVGSGTKPGDCDGIGGVSIAEVQSAINMFLGINTVKACVDQNGTGGVTIDEVQKVINGFLGL